MKESREVYVQGYYRNSRLARVKRSRSFWNKSYSLIFWWFLLISLLATIHNWHKVFPTEQVNAQIISPIPTVRPTNAPTIVIAPKPTITPSQEYTRQDIEDYVRIIFGKDARIAIAISHHECNPLNPTYPKCKNISSIEHSIGIFQINLQSKYAKVHYDRVPGTTLEEKEHWLEDPQNNTLFAYWVYSTSGWYPWSTYTSGVYKEDL